MNQEKWYKVGKGALIAMAGALAVYIPEAVSSFEWGQWTPLVVALGSVLANTLRLYIQK